MSLEIILGKRLSFINDKRKINLVTCNIKRLFQEKVMAFNLVELALRR